MGAPRSLIITDGGLTGLLAAAAAADRGGPGRGGESEGAILWAGGLDGQPPEVGGAMRSAIQRQAELFGLSEVAAAAPPESAGPARSEGEPASVLLVRAGFAAAAAGAATVVWPVSAGPELEVAIAARAIDRALLASRLVALDLGASAPEFRTPYCDFTDAQIADLVLDMDLPVWLCWWWEGGTSAGAAERDRWLGALRRAGWRGDVPGPEIVTKRPGEKPASRI